MDYLKIQNELIKAAWTRDDRHKPFTWTYGLYNDRVWVLNQHVGVAIPENRCYLDLKTVFGDKNPLNIESKRLISGYCIKNEMRD